MSGSVLFLSTMCVLDNTSGAALSVLNFLKALSKAGFRCGSFTASLMDPNREVPLDSVLGREAVKPGVAGKLLELERDGLHHHVYMTKSSRGRNMTIDEQNDMREMWKEWVVQHRPDIIITFGTSRLACDLQEVARHHGIKLVFYVGNAEYKDDAVFSNTDQIICPSEFLTQFYERTLGVNATLLRPILDSNSLLTRQDHSLSMLPEARRNGFITFMNPIPQKGLTLFIRLAQLARQERPEMKFLVVEGRMSREALQKWGVDLATYENVWWIPNQSDVKSIYARSNMVLVPSFWQEGFGKIVVEAQLNGLPVLASTQGGLVEALNGGGFAFDIPERCKENHQAYPDPEAVRLWFDRICELWDDDGSYYATVERALKAAKGFHPDKTSATAVAFFVSLLDRTGGLEPGQVELERGFGVS